MNARVAAALSMLARFGAGVKNDELRQAFELELAVCRRAIESRAATASTVRRGEGNGRIVDRRFTTADTLGKGDRVFLAGKVVGAGWTDGHGVSVVVELDVMPNRFVMALPGSVHKEKRAEAVAS